MSRTATVIAVMFAVVSLVALGCDRQAAKRKRQRRYAGKLAPAQVIGSRPAVALGTGPADTAAAGAKPAFELTLD